MFNCLSESSESDQGKYRGVIGEEVDSSDSMGFHLVVIMESVFLSPRTRGSDFTIWYIYGEWGVKYGFHTIYHMEAGEPASDGVSEYLRAGR